MSPDTLAGLVMAYAVILVTVAWVVECLPTPREGRGGIASPWARVEATRFRRAMARIVRAVAAFLMLAVLVRYRHAVWVWSGLVVLGAVVLAEIPWARWTTLHTHARPGTSSRTMKRVRRASRAVTPSVVRDTEAGGEAG